MDIDERASDAPDTESPHNQTDHSSFLRQVQATLPKNLDETSHGALNDKWAAAVLEKVQSPSKVEAHFMTDEEASATLASKTPDVPIITQGKLYSWHREPLEDLFTKWLDLDRRAAVQIPSRHSSKRSFEIQEP